MKKLVYLFVPLLLAGCFEEKVPTFKMEKPFQKIDNPTYSKTIDPTKAQIVRFENGMSVEIPKDAFVDANGDLVLDEVKLDVQSYSSVSEIMASGIPMRYTENGVEKRMESAGMFNIEGSANGQPISIKKGTNLEVNFHSNVKGEFDFFKLNKKNNEKGETLASWSKIEQLKEAFSEDFKPLKSFKLKFDTINYPETRSLASIDWKLASEFGDPTLKGNEWVLDEDWEVAYLSKPQRLLSGLLDSVDGGYGSVYTNSSMGHIYMYDQKDPIVSVYNSEGKLLIREKRETLYPAYQSESYNWNSEENFTQFFYGEEKQLTFVIDKKGEIIYDGKGEGLIRYDEKKQVLLFLEHEKGEHVIRIIDLKSNSEKRIKLDDQSYYNYSLFDSNHFACYTNSKFSVFKNDGDIVAEKSIELIDVNAGRWEHFKGNEFALICSNKQIILWDYKANTERKVPLIDFSLNDSRNIRQNIPVYFDGESNSIVFKLKNETKIWDATTGKMYEYSIGSDDSHYYHWQSKKGFYEGRYGEELNQNVIINLSTKKEILNYTSDSRYWSGVNYSNNGERLVLNNNQKKIFDSDGSLIKDFLEFDSTTYGVGYVTDEKIISLNKDGKSFIWDLNGNLITSHKFENNKGLDKRFSDDFCRYNNR